MSSILNLFLIKMLLFLLILGTSGSPYGRHMFRNSQIHKRSRNDDNSIDENNDYDNFATFAESKGEDKNKNGGVLIKNVEDIYVCGEKGVCKLVDEYLIPKDLSFDCHETNLPIFYQASIENENKSEKAFLSKDRPLITSSQKISKTCLQIKR